jgi:hypothetical protein
MGYRTKLGRIAKEERTQFMGKSCDECQRILDDRYPDENYVSLYYPPAHTQLIELGKYCQFEVQPEPFYNGFNIQEECETEFHILTKEGLHQIIREYHQKVHENYKTMLASVENPDLINRWDDNDPKQFLERRVREWDLEQNEAYLNAPHPIEMYPYYLNQPADKRDGFIAQSWQFEYQVFNLTFIYSTFDWDNDYLIYSAW